MDRRTPVCQPFKTVEDILAWEPGCCSESIASLPKRPRLKKDQPKTLVCHDMKGGYLEDRFIQGCLKPDAYRFYHWHYVDTFVYFTHYFITIPPPCWTNAAHRHGVNMLGTFITEWDDGKARCQQVLASKDSYEKFADKMVLMTQYFKFDGWLINVENVVETEAEVERLAGFVKYLTEKLHKVLPDSLVIWYDSVIKTGKLDWQNALNDKNRMFFDVCDGIFLNYCWKDEDLESSRQTAVDAKRPYDVYVGIDVFGRGCLGDGGFNTSEALQAVRKHELSAAIFGQGWVHERLEENEEFTTQENKFWRLLHELCYSCVYTSLPLSTSFCQGFGERFFDHGIPVGNTWWNLNVQQLQPNCTQAQFSENCSFSLQYHFKSPGPFPQTPPFTPPRPIPGTPTASTPATPGRGPMEWSPSVYKHDEQPTMEVCTQEAYNGGSCLRLQGEVGYSKFVKYSLFSLDVCLKQHAAVYVSVTYKIIQDPDCDIFLELHLLQGDQTNVLVLMPFPYNDKPVPSFDAPIACMYIQPLMSEELPKSLQLSATPSPATRWRTRWFKINGLYQKTSRLKLINVGLTTTDPQPKTCIALLGDVKVLPSESVPEMLPAVELVSVDVDTDPLYPLLDASKNNYDKPPVELKPEDTVDCTDPKGNAVSMTYGDIMKVRISSNTLKELRQGPNGQTFEIMYQLITSLDCFTLCWKIDSPDVIDHYNVYQIKIDSGVAKLLGHVTEPCFKVTWFEIPDYQKNEKSHHFKFVVRPVLRNGISVPLDYNYCKLFHVVSRKTSAALITETGSGELTAEADSSSGETASSGSETSDCDADSSDNESSECEVEDDEEGKMQSKESIGSVGKSEDKLAEVKGSKDAEINDPEKPDVDGVNTSLERIETEKIETVEKVGAEQVETDGNLEKETGNTVEIEKVETDGNSEKETIETGEKLDIVESKHKQDPLDQEDKENVICVEDVDNSENIAALAEKLNISGE